jgi:hypothetical protein
MGRTAAVEKDTGTFVNHRVRPQGLQLLLNPSSFRKECFLGPARGRAVSPASEPGSTRVFSFSVSFRSWLGTSPISNIAKKKLAVSTFTQKLKIC